MNGIYRWKKSRGVVLTVLIVLILMYITMTKERASLISLPQNLAKELVRLRLEMSVVQEKGTGCVMPTLDPFAEEVMKYDRDMPKVVCEGIDWVECYNSKCYVVKEILDKMKDIICIYQDITRGMSDDQYHIGPAVKLYGDATYRLKQSDHVKVSCSGKSVNGSFFGGLMPSIWYGYKAGFRPIFTKIPKGRKDTLDVLILGFDTASRNGFLRRMPRSYKFLSEELNAVVFQGTFPPCCVAVGHLSPIPSHIFRMPNNNYLASEMCEMVVHPDGLYCRRYNVVGDGTSAALFPLLTGKTELQMPDARKTLNMYKFNRIDENNFIFHSMKEDGYRTAYFEDMPWIGTFQLRFNGFERQPADHCLRSMLLAETDRGAKWWKGIKGRYCMGAVPQYAWMLNLTTQFLELDGKHFCFTMIADISHEDFNMITTAEDDLISFLQRFKEDGRLQNTLLIVIGDHGARFSDVRKTYQGRLEERMPLLAIVLPEKVKRDRPDALPALKSNVDVLTTPFDVYTTVLDAVGLREKWNYYRVPGSDLSRGMTLLQPIPKTRTCGEAGILPHWCACAKWQRVPTSDKLYQQAATALAHYINELTSDLRSQCDERKLTSISWVMRHGPNEEVLRYQGNLDRDSFLGKFAKLPVRASTEYYQAKIVMSPGDAVYEGSMVYDVQKGSLKISESDISRTNGYREESHCVMPAHPHLDKYCFCKK